MDRVLTVLALSALALGPTRSEEGTAGGALAASGTGWSATTGSFSLAQGAIGGSVSGQIDRAFVASGSAICFLPGTFQTPPHPFDAELLPSSNCGFDVSLRIEAFSEIRVGGEAARPMVVRWTDLVGRVYTLTFDGGGQHDADDARVVCLGGGAGGCQSAVVDSARAALLSVDGLARDTGPRARLTVADGPAIRDLGIYEVPFRLTIKGDGSLPVENSQGRAEEIPWEFSTGRDPSPYRGFRIAYAGRP
jgi:hypothetical protein